MKRVDLKTLGSMAGAWLLMSSVAAAASITSGHMGNGRGCTDSICASVTMTVDTSTATGVSGTLNVDTVNLRLEFDITLASAIFNPVNGSDNGITSLAFSQVRYQGSADLQATSSPTVWSIKGGFSGDVDGTANPSGAGGPALIDVTTAISGSCTKGAGLTTCGIIFSPRGFPVELNSSTRYFSNTLNVNAAVPEPASLGLLGLGLGALAVIRSRRSIR